MNVMNLAFFLKGEHEHGGEVAANTLPLPRCVGVLEASAAVRQVGSSSRHHTTPRSHHSSDALFAVVACASPRSAGGGDVLLPPAAGRQIPEGRRTASCSLDNPPAARDKETSLRLKGLLGRRIEEAGSQRLSAAALRLNLGRLTWQIRHICLRMQTANTKKTQTHTRAVTFPRSAHL